MSHSENVMGTEPVGRLVIRTGVPLMLSLFINSLYNFVDSVFVSRVSEDALAAVSLAAPAQMLMSAMGLGIAIGLNAIISRALGQNDRDEVRRTASAAIFLGVCAWLLSAVLCLLFIDPFFRWQADGNAAIAAYGKSYLGICMLGSLGMMGQWVFDRLVMASGRASLFLFTLSAASVTNLILDPIFIFGLAGMPAMGVTGAALATVVGQFVGCFAGIAINRRYNREIPIVFTPRVSARSVLAILKVGVPTTLVQLTSSVVSMTVNTLLIAFSSTAVAVFGVCTKVQNLALVGVRGINNGLIPIVAYNYGARKHERVTAAVRWALLYSTGIYLLFLAVMELFPQMVLQLFDASPDLLHIGVPALRILALAYLLSTAGLVAGASLQGLGLGSHSMLVTAVRQIVLPLGLVLLASLSGQLHMMWWAFVAAELAAMPFILWMWKRVCRRVLQ